MDRDQFTNANLRSVSKASMAALSQIQDHPKGVQPAAIAAMFLAYSEASGVPAQDLMTVTQNMISHADGRRPEFKALVRYVEGELL